MIKDKMKISNKFLWFVERNRHLGYEGILENMQKFIDDVGYPFLGQVPGDNTKSYVTFVYLEPNDVEPPKNIVLNISGMRDNEINPKDYTLTNIEGTIFWYITLKFDNRVKLQYNFILNHKFETSFEFAYESFKNGIPDILNEKQIIGHDERIIENVLLMEDCQYIPVHQNMPRNGTYRQIELMTTYQSDDIRTFVFLPEYYSELHPPYKYLVLTDAQVYLDVIETFRILENLIYMEEIEPICVFLIDSNDETRINDYNFNNKYMRFLAKEFILTMQEDWNISLNPKDATIGGFSLGGLNAINTAIKYSKVFGNVIAQSPLLFASGDIIKPESVNLNKFKTGTYTGDLLAKKRKMDINFYQSIGTLEGDVIHRSNNNFVNLLSKLGYKYEFSTFQGAHQSISWQQDLIKALKYLYKIDKSNYIPYRC